MLNLSLECNFQLHFYIHLINNAFHYLQIWQKNDIFDFFQPQLISVYEYFL